MSYEWLLFGHLVGAFLFVGGAVAAAVLRVAAMGKERRPAEVAVLLRSARLAIPPIAVGLVLVLVFGFWLTGRLDRSLGETWLSLTFLLLGWIVVVGALTGRQDRHTRELAERLARDGVEHHEELARRLRDPLNLALSTSLLLATAAIVALMVWQP
ncbi:MAG: hypothetical protein KatS3mg012_2581 [Gaiellaceae bacterium]|jgi:uncharacterized membrane protein|nr:MAG: hypothetical protein KatS3mg012_2581 [Gaiellaceae bacterium]